MCDKKTNSYVATAWSYYPYRPPLIDRGDIYITRIVPGNNSIKISWKKQDAETCFVYWRKRELGEYHCTEAFTDGEAIITDLEEGCDYQFYLQDNEYHKSLVRLARTGNYIGLPIQYLHPEDKYYAFAGQYLGSPTIVRQPDGSLLASMDVFPAIESEQSQNLTLIYRSDDDGKTWHWQCELYPCMWGKLFVFKGEVYILGCSIGHGDILLGKTTDGGKSFATPVVLMRGPGLSNACGPDLDPQPPVEYGGRLWFNFHWGTGHIGIHYPCVASAPVDSNILEPANWVITPPCLYDEKWPGTAQGKSSGTLEGTFAVLPDGKLYILARYGIFNCIPDYGMVILYKVRTDDPSAPLEYVRTVSFDGNHSKFTIIRDEESGWYYSIISRIRGSLQKKDRNLLSLVKSPDCIQWVTALDMIDLTDRDPSKTGLQYVDFFLEGKKLYYVCRAAINGADNFHNTNTILFGILTDFRKY